MYYTFGALGGAPQAEMSLGYRHWVGFGTKQSCGDALPYYKSAADRGAGPARVFFLVSLVINDSNE